MSSNFFGSMSYVSGLRNIKSARVPHAKELEIVASPLLYGVDGLDLVALWTEAFVAVGEVVAVPALTVFYKSEANRTWTVAVMTRCSTLPTALAARVTCC